MNNNLRNRLPIRIMLATSIVGLFGAVFVAAAKYYQAHKTHAKTHETQSAMVPESSQPHVAVPTVPAQSIWQGTFITQGNAAAQPGSLIISQRFGELFHGICSLGSEGKNEVSEVEGRIRGDEITFWETKLVKGTNDVPAIPCAWKAVVSGDHMKGMWWRTRNGNGTFELVNQKPE